VNVTHGDVQMQNMLDFLKISQSTR